MNNSYNCIKDYIKDRIIRYSKDNEITLDLIEKEIENVNKIFSSGSAEYVFYEKIQNMSNEKYSDLKKELEAHFSVKAEEGILIKNKEDIRDYSWWSSKEKNDNKDLYYWDRYKKSLENKLPRSVLRTLDIDTDVIMDNIENPKLSRFARRGMVVGHVQSGKTGNYSGLICKAADAGYKFIVVIAGGINNLRNQTQNRLNESFVGKDGNIDLEIKKISGFKNSNSKQPISLTTSKTDFNINDANKQSINFDNINVPILLVIKKNVKSLENVIKWINGHTKGKINHHSMLVIDDESDYGTVNYKADEDPTQINKKIRKLISLFDKSSYVAYTATPFANIFINHESNSDEVGEDLFPKDFIYALDAPSNYIGAKKFFDPDLDVKDLKYLTLIDDYKTSFPLIQKAGHKVDRLPTSLKEAINLFLLNISIRHLRGQSNESNSMLIHASRFTNVHSQIANLVDDFFSDVKQHIKSFSYLKNSKENSIYIKNLSDTYLKYIKQDFAFEDVLIKLENIINTVKIYEVHQKSKIELEYRKNYPINIIAVGGTSLSRGYTLEGLNVSYFTRNSMFYDTLMQMGRWFGYRNNYEDLCKVFIPEPIATNFQDIMESTDELMNNLQQMKEFGMTPEQFGLGVKYHPATQLKITAANKMRNAQDFKFSISFQGTMVEEHILYSEKNENDHNLKVMNSFINKISNNYNFEKKASNYLWTEVNIAFVNEFLDKFKSCDRGNFYNYHKIKALKLFLSENTDKIDIALLSTEKKSIEFSSEISVGVQKRKIEKYDNYIKINRAKVSGSNPEKILSDEYKTLTSLEIRQKMKRPLLMLHLVVENNTSIDENSLKEENNIIYPSFGISFPSFSDGKITKSDINIKVNTVMIKNFENSFEEYDDEYSEED